MKILILGGTGEARTLAGKLVALGHSVISSMAGRTSDPLLPEGKLRVGKFGGVPGMVAYLRANGINRLIDATHPYAGLISVNAVLAGKAAGVPMLRFMRAPWTEPEGAGWLHVADVAEAARILPSGATVLLTTGHGGLEEFFRRDDCEFLVRLIDAPGMVLPRHMHVLLARPPYELAAEIGLMRSEAITHLVSKNSGGAQTAGKLEAARTVNARVVMIERPAYGPAKEVADVDEAVAWVGGVTAPR